MLAAQGYTETPGLDPNVWPEGFFHRDLWPLQSQLRATIAALQYEDFHNNMTEDEQYGRNNHAVVRDFPDFDSYIERMSRDALMEAEAFGSVDMEGPYVAQYYGRPFVVMNNRDNSVIVCFPDTLELTVY